MIKCIAIDDEPLALTQIKGYIEKTPFLSLEATFESGIEALDYLQNNKIDLMFVDIQMPDLNGMDLVKSLSNRPEVIFTTAYSDYAVEGFKVDALDYVLKPLDYPTFLKAANKAQKHFGTVEITADNHRANINSLFIKSEHRIMRIEINQILFIEGMREYVRIHLENMKPVMTLISMKKIALKLPETQYMRIHRSYIVNLEKITTIERSRVIFDKVIIPVSDQHKEKFQKYIKDNFLI